ncbi:MAG: hypothetical protein IJL56_03920 [Bacteroidales bacterium]|nr:hypothetical protein [Bacteroidales bacterium]
MPLFRPSILLSDAYGSAGEVTFYHRNGRCYTRKRVNPQYPGTPAQLEHLAIHRRAMAAWASLDSDVQKLWNTYETTAEPHRPPFDHKAHISGNNLFVSAYHGFALMGNEHAPAAQPFQAPPPFIVTFDCVTVEAGKLRLAVDAHVSQNATPKRYRLYARLRLTNPGKGYGVREMRGFLAEGDCSRLMSITIPGYTEIWNLSDERFQIQAMCILLDSETGFRSQYQRTIAVLSL